MNPVKIYLLRHGHVDFPRGLFYGQMDVPLSEKGKRQSLLAARQVVRMGIDAVVSSDLGRCSYLSGLIQMEGGPEPLFSESIREINFGRWTGLSWDDIERDYPGAMTRRMEDLKTYRPPGGESLGDLLKRAKGLFKRCTRGDFGEHVAFVAHGGVNRVLIADFLGMSLQDIFSLQQDHACISCIEFFPDGNGVLRFLNMTAHLDQALSGLPQQIDPTAT